MNITLTANAGVLIELDGLRILLDGVCEPTEYYLGTPKIIRDELIAYFPDAVGFTHKHSDHFDNGYAELYKQKTLRPIFGSECSSLRVGGVELSAIDTRHLGKTDVSHKSFIIKGSRSIFFMGDASPTELRRLTDIVIPDVLIAPFAYFSTEAALRMTEAADAKELVLVHMPSKENDPSGIWKSVDDIIKRDRVRYFTNIGDTVALL